MAKDNKQEKTKDFFSNAWKKTADISKKTAEGIQKGAKSLSEHIEKKSQDRQRAKEEPITLKTYKSKTFHMPNIIVIEDDAEKRGHIVYEGAIGYRKKHKANNHEVEVFYLFDEYINSIEIQFIPFPKCDDIYCVDPFDAHRFINSNEIFEKCTNEKLAELEHIAYSLGAKKYSIEIVEKNKITSSAKSTIGTNASQNKDKKDNEEKGTTQTIIVSAHAQNHQEIATEQSGKISGTFEGSDNPRKPNLKWFTHDESIKNLIEMRCSDKNAIKSRKLKLSGSAAKIMSIKVACAIDGILKGSGNTTKMSANFSMEKEAVKEHNKYLLYEIEF